MALNAKRPWIIAYDITSSKRLNRVHRYLKTQAIPLQYSVFLAEESGQSIHRILDRLNALIDPRADDVRAYPLPLKPEVHSLGVQAQLEGLSLMTPALGELGNLLCWARPRRQQRSAEKFRQPPMQPIETEDQTD
jgi:CRISPR-associated protein Cas2